MPPVQPFLLLPTEKNFKRSQGDTTTLTDIQTSKSNIQHQLAIIQSFQKPLQELTADLQYKTRIYQQSIAGNLQEIKTIQENTLQKTPKIIEIWVKVLIQKNSFELRYQKR